MATIISPIVYSTVFFTGFVVEDSIDKRLHLWLECGHVATESIIGCRVWGVVSDTGQASIKTAVNHYLTLWWEQNKINDGINYYVNHNSVHVYKSWGITTEGASDWLKVPVFQSPHSNHLLVILSHNGIHRTILTSNLNNAVSLSQPFSPCSILSEGRSSKIDTNTSLQGVTCWQTLVPNIWKKGISLS